MRDKILIENINNKCYRTIANYSRHLFTCDIVLKSFFDKQLLAKYRCDYLLKREGNKRYIEYPDKDLTSELETLAPSEFSVCAVTEQYPNNDNYIIQATFNIYKQIQALGNHKFYDVKICDILS